jgi:hypothetical protein
MTFDKRKRGKPDDGIILDVKLLKGIHDVDDASFVSKEKEHDVLLSVSFRSMFLFVTVILAFRSPNFSLWSLV